MNISPERPRVVAHTYRECGDEILVEATPFFLPERSNPNDKIWFFGYQISIQNLSETPVTLEAREWVIRDGNGKEETVQGKGVVGQNPTILPGEKYTYSSYCPLGTSTGNMRGRYYFKTATGKFLSAKIPLFFLRTH